MYRKTSHLHFVGIGGIGMSGIAKILKYQGYFVSGCDLDLEQKSVEELIELGCPITHGATFLLPATIRQLMFWYIHPRCMVPAQRLLLRNNAAFPPSRVP